MINKESGIPIYIQIQEILEGMLLNGTLKANALVPSENEFAEKLNVSRLTVRKGYSEMIKRNFFYTIQGKGTYVRGDYLNAANNLEDVESQKVIGVIFPEITQFFSEILDSIRTQAALNGYSISLMFNDDLQKEITAIRSMIRSKVCGVIITPSRNSSTVVEHYQQLINTNIPVVMIGKPPFKILSDAVYCDDVFAAYRSVEIFIEHEHKHIGYVTNNQFLDESDYERQTGYLNAIKDYMPLEEPIIFDIHSPDFVSQIKKAVLDDDPVTAFFCYCDSAAFIIYEKVKALGKKVPEDIEIIGYDDVISLYIGSRVKLSSVNQRREEMGRNAVLLLTQKIGIPPSKLINSHIIIQPKIIRRETTRQNNIGE